MPTVPFATSQEAAQTLQKQELNVKTLQEAVPFTASEQESGTGPLIPPVLKWESRIILKSADFGRHFVSHFLRWSAASVSAQHRTAPSGLSFIYPGRAW